MKSIIMLRQVRTLADRTNFEVFGVPPTTAVVEGDIPEIILS